MAGRLHKHALDESGNKKWTEEATNSKKKSDDAIYSSTVEAIKNKEGCQIEGEVQLHKVPGNFHLSSHDYPKVFERLLMNNYRIDFSHTLNHLSFGDMKESTIIERQFGEKAPNELNGTKINMRELIPFGQLMVNHYLDLTELEFQDSTVLAAIKDESDKGFSDKHPSFSMFKYRALT